MKTSLIVRALAVLLLSATSLCFAQEPEENGGILNGPLNDRNLGHRASGEGNHESLRLAIEHLSNTYGGNYPKGEEFLKRLEEVQDPGSDEFKSLKREALLVANPAIDFDQYPGRAGPQGRQEVFRQLADTNIVWRRVAHLVRTGRVGSAGATPRRGQDAQRPLRPLQQGEEESRRPEENS